MTGCLFSIWIFFYTILSLGICITFLIILNGEGKRGKGGNSIKTVMKHTSLFHLTEKLGLPTLWRFKLSSKVQSVRRSIWEITDANRKLSAMSE